MQQILRRPAIRMQYHCYRNLLGLTMHMFLTAEWEGSKGTGATSCMKNLLAFAHGSGFSHELWIEPIMYNVGMTVISISKQDIKYNNIAILINLRKLLHFIPRSIVESLCMLSNSRISAPCFSLKDTSIVVSEGSMLTALNTSTNRCPGSRHTLF